MTIHGDQLLLPLFIRKSNDLPPIVGDDELTLSFYLLTKDLKESEKILSFAKLLWPFESLPGVISTHIMLDGLMLFKKEGKLTNPPRQPLIGHVLRNIENKTQLEVLDTILDILTYKDSAAEEIGENEESEYQSLRINSLINTQFLHTLLKLLPYLEYKPIKDFMPLEATLSTDNALKISEHYRDIIETLKGNAMRWETQIELINKEVDKWLLDLNVKIKDINSRYASQISKITSEIDDTQIKQQIELEGDKIDLWKENEKKRLIENMSILFKTLERSLEDLVKKNRFYSSSETLKRKPFDNLMPSVNEHLNFLKEGTSNLLSTIDQTNQKVREIREQATEVDADAKRKLIGVKEVLNKKLQSRNEQLNKFKKEQQELLLEIETLKKQIETRISEINKVIQKKATNCRQEAKDLQTWSLEDNLSDLFKKPIQWIYMPIYAMFVEDEDMMEENMKVVFPGIITSDLDSIYELEGEFIKLRNLISILIEEDMAIRSNFEFSCDSKNLIQDLNFKKRIEDGISILKKKGLFNEEMERIVRKNLELINN